MTTTTRRSLIAISCVSLAARLSQIMNQTSGPLIADQRCSCLEPLCGHARHPPVVVTSAVILLPVAASALRSRQEIKFRRRFRCEIAWLTMHDARCRRQGAPRCRRLRRQKRVYPSAAAAAVASFNAIVDDVVVWRRRRRSLCERTTT